MHSDIILSTSTPSVFLEQTAAKYEESNFKSKVRATAYPCVERNDIIWTYMGPRQTPPPLPDLEPNMLPRGEYVVQKVLRECNWFQGLEGDIDTGHLSFLHLGAIKPEDTKPGSFDYYLVADRAPRYEVVETEFGTSYRRVPSGRSGHLLLALRPLPLSLLHDDPDGHPRHPDPRPRLGAGRRRAHHVLEPVGAAVADGRWGRGQRGRAADRRPVDRNRSRL
jgi:hypothetical protein